MDPESKLDEFIKELDDANSMVEILSLVVDCMHRCCTEITEGMEEADAVDMISDVGVYNGGLVMWSLHTNNNTNTNTNTNNNNNNNNNSNNNNNNRPTLRC